MLYHNQILNQNSLSCECTIFLPTSNKFPPRFGSKTGGQNGGKEKKLLDVRVPTSYHLESETPR